jgi:trk system potassium uptake protein TrkH
LNFRYVAKLLGLLIAFISATMIFPLLWSLGVGESAMVRVFVRSMIIGLGLGGALYFVGRRSEQEFFRREGLAVVSLGWIIGAAVGALPFWLCGEFREAHGFIDAYFESMSGFTTTGSTVLSDIESMPMGLLFWRSFTQWLGGMGIVVLFVAVLPALGVHAKQLYKVEVPGIKKEGSMPRIRDAASLLWKIYVGFSVAETLLLKLGGMSWFDALNHTFTTLATGGFSTKNASIAAFDSLYIEIIIMVFMALVGTNFALYVGALRGRFRDFLTDTEYQTYLVFIMAATVMLTITLLYGGVHQSPGRAFRESAFQAVAIMTTTGYCTADFDGWTQFARVLLVALMFIGGCAGSTGGSMKVIRIIVVFKASILQIQKFFFPRMVKQVKIGGVSIPEETLQNVTALFMLFVGTWVAGTIYMAALGMDLETAATSVIATLGNIGPGLAGVGAVENFGWIPAPGKIFLSLCMVLGRLELYTVLVLFMPAFWQE